MRIPMPFAAVAHRARDAWSYFRTGVKVEGQAWLCSNEHLQVWVSGMPVKQVPQHVDVELRFWNRRGPRVTVSEIADARIPLFGLVLADGAWPEFKPLTLEPGDPPLEANFVLVPKGAPKVGPRPRVEAFTGAILELEFRPSRGSEPRVDSGATCRGARPPQDLRLPSHVRDVGDRARGSVVAARDDHGHQRRADRGHLRAVAEADRRGPSVGAYDTRAMPAG